jgi:caa(3)-type oxidase subunit IV
MHHEQKPIVFEHEHAPPNSIGVSIMVFIALGVLTFFALAIGFASGLGTGKIYFSLGVAVAQACVLTYFSMELKNHGVLIWFSAIASIFWTFLLFLFTLTDYLTRGLSSPY